MSMSPAVQPLHIFRKDALHLWPETIISTALLVALAWMEPQSWTATGEPSTATVLLALGLGFLKFLIPIAWLVLCSRLVHDEELVGDRQFWITRPYTWYSLLSSKVIYLAVFIGIPFLIMQMWLLHHAGMYPTHVIPAMLKNFVIVAAVFLLPLLAIAAATATFIRYISSVLVGVIYLFAVVIFCAFMWSDKLDAPYLNYILFPLVGLMILAALIVQYWLRKTLIARLLLVSVPLIFIVFAILAPSNLLSDHRYPNVSVGKVTLDTSAQHQQPAGRLFSIEHKVILQLPVQVELPGMSDETFVQVQRYRATIDGPNGFHFASDWIGTRASFASAESSYVLPLPLPEKVYNQIHNQPVALHIDLGTETYHEGTPYNVTATETPFPIPGHGACMVAVESGELECRFPFENPEFLQVIATVHSGNCLIPGPQTAIAYGSLTPSTPGLHFSPVETAKTQLTVGETKVTLCPGTMTTFKPAVEGAYGRMHLDIPTITLDPYALRIPVKAAVQTAPVPQAQPAPNAQQ